MRVMPKQVALDQRLRNHQCHVWIKPSRDQEVLGPLNKRFA